MASTAPQTLPLDVALRQAIAHHQAGRLQEAVQLYRAILQAQPRHAEANHNLGMIACQVGQHAAGLPYLQAALSINPDNGQFPLSYADALLATGKVREAQQILQSAMQRGLDTPAARALRKKVETTALAYDKNEATLTPATIDRLIALFNLGQYAKVERRALDLLERDPDAGFAWKLLGACLKTQGKEAVPALQNAARLLPADAEAQSNLGIALQDIGQLDSAVACYRRALAINPRFAEVCNNLGVALKDLRQLDEAAASYRRALEIRPDYAEAHNNLGFVQQELGCLEDALASYRRAVEIRPDLAEAHYNVGNVLKALVRFEDAAASYRRALELKPDYAHAHNNLGFVQQEQGNFEDAAASYRRALQVQPDYAEAHYNLGTALQNLKCHVDAAASYRRALEIKLDYAEAYANLGMAVKDLGRLDEADANFRQALRIKPGFAEAHSNLLFTQSYRHDRATADLLADALRFGDMVAGKAPAHQSWQNAPDPQKCLRVGLVSGDLRNHPVGFFLQDVLAALAAQSAGRLQLVAYATQSSSDTLTERIKTYCHGWHSAVGLSDARLAQKIRDDGIDILLDLSGHTAHNRLPMFAWKPAPVQASWLGYFATTGVAAIDYLIADPWTLPASEEIYFTEKIWRLPETRLCFTAPEVELDVAPLPALANGYVTFGCFNNLAKMNDQVVAVWAKVLQANPRSKLFLKAAQLNEASMQQNTIARFVAHGIDPTRLTIEGTEPREQYLAAYGRVDIALDPFPYPGGTTTVEGLWMGVPALTLAGTCFLARQGVGILMNAGLPEWIAVDADDYVARTVSHAADLPRLSALRERLRQQALASPLFDAPRFARHFEAALRGMWIRWCENRREKDVDAVRS